MLSRRLLRVGDAFLNGHATLGEFLFEISVEDERVSAALRRQRRGK